MLSMNKSTKKNIQQQIEQTSLKKQLEDLQIIVSQQADTLKRQEEEKKQLMLDLQTQHQALQSAIQDKAFLQDQLNNSQAAFIELKHEVEKMRIKLLDPNALLCKAAVEGDLEKAKAAIDILGASINMTDAQGFKPWMVSFLNGHTDLAGYLIDKDENFQVISSEYLGFMDKLAQDKKFTFVDQLLARFQKTDKDAKQLLTAHERVGDQTVKKMIANQILLQAAKQGSVSLAQQALQLGADINVQDKKNHETALHKAVYGGYKDLALFLVKNGSSTAIEDTHHQTANQVTSNPEMQQTLNAVNQSAIKIQAATRGFFARSAVKQTKYKLEEKAQTLITHYLLDRNYDKALALTQALQAKNYSVLDQILMLNEQQEFALKK